MKKSVLSACCLLAACAVWAQPLTDKDLRRQAQLFTAVEEQNQEALAKLLKKKACRALINLPQADGGTLLHKQARIPDASPAITRLLTAAGADAKARDGRERTPLHYAAEFGEPGTLRALLLAGADPEAYDEYGKTPLDLARAARRRAAFEILKEHILSRYYNRKILAARLAELHPADVKSAVRGRQIL